MKTVVYTCVSGNYDCKVTKPAEQRRKTEFKAFLTDSKVLTPGWKRAKTLEETRFLRNDLINRYHKILFHRIDLDADISIYIDGNIEIVSSLEPLLTEFELSGADIGICIHPQRATITDELEALKRLKKFKSDDAGRASSQIKYTLECGFPLNYGLFAATVIFRKSSCAHLSLAMDEWWLMVNKFTARDQLSLPFVLWKYRIRVHCFHFNILQPNEWFVRRAHRIPFSKKIYRYLIRSIKRVVVK